MTTLAQARNGLKTVLDSIAGLRVYDYVPDDAHYPAAIIQPPLIPDYREDIGDGSVMAVFPVLVVVPATIDRLQVELHDYFDRSGSKSIFAVLEADRSLGGLDVDAYATSVRPVDLMQIASTSVWGAAVNIQVFIS